MRTHPRKKSRNKSRNKQRDALYFQANLKALLQKWVSHFEWVSHFVLPTGPGSHGHLMCGLNGAHQPVPTVADGAAADGSAVAGKLWRLVTSDRLDSNIGQTSSNHHKRRSQLDPLSRPAWEIYSNIYNMQWLESRFPGPCIVVDIGFRCGGCMSNNGLELLTA